MAHANEKLLRAMDEAQGKGDMETMFSFFTDDVVAHIGGRSKLAGDKKGKDELLATFGMFMQSLGDDPTFETHDVLANDTHGIILQRFGGTRGGKSIELGGFGIFHFTNGKISEVWFHDMDPYTADPWYDAGP